MGANQSRVVNNAGQKLHVITFNNSNTFYWTFNEERQPPVDKRPITVEGRCGGGAVKVGVVYNREDGRLFYDLFRVNHGITLSIRTITEDSGVTGYEEVAGVELLKLGASIKAGSDKVEELERGVRMASTITGNVVQGSNVAVRAVTGILSLASNTA